MDLKLGTNIFESDNACWKLIQEEVNKSSLKIKKGKVNGKVKSDHNIRVSDVSFSENEKLARSLFNEINSFNLKVSGWNFDISGVERPQYTFYHKGGYYDWHQDTISSISSAYDPHLTRKISITIFLNDPDDYEGGELDIETEGPDKKIRYDTFKLPKRSIVIFPSSKWHRVRPITSGFRKSLVAWFIGPPFK